MKREEFERKVSIFFKQAEEERKERLKREEEQFKLDLKIVKDFFVENFEVTKEEIDKLSCTETFYLCFYIFCLYANACVNKEKKLMNFFMQAIDKMREELSDRKLNTNKREVKSDYINSRNQTYKNMSRQLSKRK